jgi:hypothetical protein
MVAVSAAKNRRVRKKYHTNTKLQAKLGILPEKVKKLIPKSTLYGFRQYNYSRMFRFAEQNDCDLMLEFSKKIINNKIIRKALQMYKAYNRLKTTALDIFTQIKNIKPHMRKFIPEYNNVRPHCAHKYLTPAQVYFGQTVDLAKIKKQYEKARKRWILENKKIICPVCS